MYIYIYIYCVLSIKTHHVESLFGRVFSSFQIQHPTFQKQYFRDVHTCVYMEREREMRRGLPGAPRRVTKTILYYTRLYYTILYYTVLYYTILYYTVLYYTILYYTVLYYTILYDAMLYYTILYYTIL